MLAVDSWIVESRLQSIEQETVDDSTPHRIEVYSRRIGSMLSVLIPFAKGHRGKDLWNCLIEPKTLVPSLLLWNIRKY